ncbi:hypothetical protein CYLTODRAFT_494233 [Cylindrobasidium torrendii FP15055 ss-10]|uniref:VHS domain-containing protein n=1 Tax=Cylindrobasidium torrendii FP15055 ss-10 TaxID=1314674 RepID=A0A0D7AYR2_9AGAR|nr:hypothetical protein CYLTODRAFT_494233 [Cylindrobasidium torrendii FP15055 ss-10]
MSGFSLAKQIFGTEKPHSSITDWIEILTANNVAEEAYDGIPELVDSINLQPQAGPTEASRAIRKKLKHGLPHQQYRGLVILKALVENCGDKFKSTFADGQLTDALRHLASDSSTDKRVKKKLIAVLKSWHDQFHGDPAMHIFSSLYQQASRESRSFEPAPVDTEAQKRKLEEAKRKAQEKQEAKDRARIEEENRKKAKYAAKNKLKPKRAPFNFEQEKPKVLSSIAEASQASSNLVNAITLVNTDNDSVQSNARVQECLEKTKLIRKQIVRYVQLVENEELIGTLIETNDRIIQSLELYDNVVTGVSAPPEPTEDVTEGMAKVHMTGDSEVYKLQEKQRAAVQRHKGKDAVFSDLQDIDFLGSSSTNLPEPMRPSSFSSASQPSYNNRESRGSLSDFSDYASSDEETHKNQQGAKLRYYDSDEERYGSGAQTGPSNSKLVDDEDPFADPFRD